MRTIFLIALASALISCGNRDTPSLNLPGADPNDHIQDSRIISFEGREGEMPAGWLQTSMGEGTADWKLIALDGETVLAQNQPGNPNKHFNLAIYEHLDLKNPDIAVELKAIKGFLDQGGGLVWRYQNEKNHYIVRANPLENNVVLYKMEDGVRSDLPLVDQGHTYGMTTGEMGLDWHRLHVRVQDSLFTVFFDGRQLYRVIDQTFAGSGKIGLWTKADAATAFRKLEIRN